MSAHLLALPGLIPLAFAAVLLALGDRRHHIKAGLNLLGMLANLGVVLWLFLQVQQGVPADLVHYTDPMPQSLVLTAIVIGFATTALFLVVLLALRGLTDSDHVDGGTPP